MKSLSLLIAVLLFALAQFLATRMKASGALPNETPDSGTNFATRPIGSPKS
jgi:hypothetical protein